MPAVIYYERKKYGKNWKWVKKILISTKKGRIVYDGVLDVKNVKILKMLKENIENFDEFKKKYLMKRGEK